MKKSTKNITKISKSQEQSIGFISACVATFITAIGIAQIVLIATQTQNKPTTITNEAENHKNKVKDLAKKELVLSKIKEINAYVLIQNENVATISHSKLKINNTGNKEKIIPFFFSKSDGDAFKNELLINENTVKVERVSLGFIYEEFINKNEINDYILFQKNKSKEWEIAKFENIPIYYPQNKKSQSPFFIEQKGKIVAIPYFLSKKYVEEAIGNLGENWQVKEVNLLNTLDHIATHELGYAINIIGP